MFETQIQKSWDKFESDWGLARILIVLCLVNIYYFLYSGVAFGAFRFEFIWAVGCCLVAFFVRPIMARRRERWKLIFNALPTFITVYVDYRMIGELDRMKGALPRQDLFFAQWDQAIFGSPVAHWIYQLFTPESTLQTIVYDCLQFSYLCFYIFPLAGVIMLYKHFPRGKRFLLGRFHAQVIFLFMINYFCYLAVPVIGPQFYLEKAFFYPLPLSFVGKIMNQIVVEGQSTFIDCFPSGHSGIAILVAFCLWRVRHPARYYMVAIATMIIFSTMALRYHYVLDVIAAIPLVVLSYQLGKLLVPIKFAPRSKYKKGEDTYA